MRSFAFSLGCRQYAPFCALATPLVSITCKRQNRKACLKHRFARFVVLYIDLVAIVFHAAEERALVRFKRVRAVHIHIRAKPEYSQ